MRTASCRSNNDCSIPTIPALKRTLSFFLLASCTILGISHAAEFSLQELEPVDSTQSFETGFTRLSADSKGLTIPNSHADPRMWGELFRELTLGSLETGLAVADFNNDGRLDIYAVSKNGPCALYLQTEPFKFEEVALSAGVAANETIDGKAGASAIDINQDGWADIYLCRYDAPNLLFVNNGDGTFTESAAEHGLDISDASVHASFADFDRDGDLDCYLVTNILRFAVNPRGRNDYLLQNDGSGRFKDVSSEAGLWGVSQGHSAIWFDANQDGWPDIYVANDFETPDRFYLNNGDGTFTDVVDERLPHVTYFSMGADSGDINNDGLIDYFVADMRDRSHEQYLAGLEELGRGLWEMERVPELIPQYMWNALYLNGGNDRYNEMAHMAGMEATGWTWATRMADFDCDGFQDVFFTNGMIRNFTDADLVDLQKKARTLNARAGLWKRAPRRDETNIVYRNQGNLSFEDVSAAWGLDELGISFGAATADFDGDGDLDLVYTNFDAPPTIARNNQSNGNRFVVKLVGKAPNHDAIGAEIRIETESGQQVRQLYSERGIVSSEPAIAYFGLGKDQQVKRLTVRWPDGSRTELENLPAGHLLTLRQSADTAAPSPLSPPDQVLFAETATLRGLTHESKLLPYDELGNQRLLPVRLNGQGPAIATSDVNQDGRSDLFIAGSAGQSGILYLAQTDGSYLAASKQPWSLEAEADDLGAAFFDLNSDTYPDLFIAAGGINTERGNPLQNDRIYLNDGFGNFSRAPEDSLPPDGESTKAVAAADFDGDGQIDLFVGGRYVSGRWPDTPRSFLYRNNDGILEDVSENWAPGIRETGMVTAAIACDVNNDSLPDLLLATEWGSIQCYLNRGSRLENASSTLGLAHIAGCWSSMEVADFNNDGRLDIVAGNRGLNTKYHASAEEPSTLFVGPFNDDNRNYIVEARYNAGQLKPVRGLSKLKHSFPWLAGRFTTYRQYSESTLEEIVGPEKLSLARKLEVNELASGVFLQGENGRFEYSPLPREAQLSPIFAIAVIDYDRDGSADLLVAGNDFGGEPSTGRFDGGLGLLLKGDGDGSFAPVWGDKSGILVTGEARAMAVVARPSEPETGVVVVRNAGPVLFFERTENP